ncbi:MAG TPA: MauE/DoxX family redox-associated membrane protein [Lacipirellulaceae bacterium]|nr:MauE/DoxX family redox-associated membrane protein [Lacipirellulaceae bacterium]HMP06405.1 MauE/DoxX family redox-associated membrane protein [Lacipirellulaceae bacterium]
MATVIPIETKDDIHPVASLAKGATLRSMAWQGARIILGVVLILAAWGKISNPYAFLMNIYDFRLVGPTVARLTAALLPFAELGLAACLLSGISARVTMLLTVSVFALFVIVLTSVIIRGIVVSCGCFGVASGVSDVSWLTVIRTSTLLLIALVGYWGVKGR